MKLESKFFQSFFYPFLVGVIFSAIVIITSTIIFTSNYMDKITGQNLVELGKKYSKVNIDSVNVLVSTTLLKMQASLNELILYYQNLAKKLNTDNPYLNRKIDDNFLKCVLDLNDTYNENNEFTNYMAYWIKDLETNHSSLKDNSFEKKELTALSGIIPNIFNTFYSTNSSSLTIYFYFEASELFISYPLKYSIKIGFIKKITNYTDNQVWCTDERGEIFPYYKTKCREFFINIQRAKSDVFDKNYGDNVNRTIFVTEFYAQAGEQKEPVFTMCIEFTDTFSGKPAYACADILKSDLYSIFESINKKLNGYFFINSVGFAHSFYYPESNDVAYTATEDIFNWHSKFFLEEKTHFSNQVQKLMTSNYIKYMDDSLFSEVYSNGINADDQIFFINGEKFEFSIYPVILENYNGAKEHILNIIYIYNNNLFYEEFKNEMKIYVQVIIEAITFIVFGSGLLYLVALSFNILAKYIVIPIKNVNYMLKGINIGGENRLEYLNFLKQRQDENVELLEKMYFQENKNDKNNNESSNHLKEDNMDNNDLIDEGKNKKNDTKEELPLIDNNENFEKNNTNNIEETTEFNDELINSNIDYYKKFNEENDFIEKESTFYNFDEQLLQYRPLEIDRLVKALIDLKGALYLTSMDQQAEQIINYSNSEEIFRNFKNKEGTTICQSNIGNLQSQLSKYDKAIYHLAKSLEDNKLKRFLSRTLSDELDESDTLLNKISISFHVDKQKTKNNILVEKQQNNTKNNFSQKIIGILINSRYSKLIHVYFRFFSLIQKLNAKALNGLFMNTTYHNINYYHKVIIEYIYLCYAKNDLVKIGESILDYIEFLMKFKFKTSKENKHILDIRYINLESIGKRLLYKKKIFNKIINWFTLFDDYVTYVRKYTSLGDDKSILDDFSTVSSETNEFNSGSLGVFLFRVNIQRSEYLKGKFSLRCKNYTDALFYFIRAAKKKSIVIDGLIKKKSLKKISKILIDLHKKYDNYGIIRWSMREKILEYEKTKMRYFNKKYTQGNIGINLKNEDIINASKNNTSNNTFKKEMKNIKEAIIKDISECNAKQEKDIIIIIDFNKYDQEMNYITFMDKIDSYMDQAKTILNNYLSSNDRYSVFIYKTQYQIICPLVPKNKIDIDSFSKDLIYYKKSSFKEDEEDDEESSIKELNENDLEKAKLGIKSSGKNLSNSGSLESFYNDGNERTIDDIIKDLVDSINYSKNYLKIKQEIKNEKYIILFSDIFNTYKMTDEIISSNFQNLNKDKEVTLLLVGKSKAKNKDINKIANNEDLKKFEENIKKKFGDRSEVIEYENMKKIKTILSNNNVIKDEIIYPNEIYK